MKKFKILIGRGINSRRVLRRINSATDLVGEQVEVSEDDVTTAGVVDSVEVSEEGDATVTLDNGTEVELPQDAVEELVETGEVIDEETDTVAKVTEEAQVNSDEVESPETEEFVVTREVENEDGETTEVATNVEAESEGDAIKTVEVLDSRRGRNSRGYRAVRKTNSECANCNEFKIQRNCTGADGKVIRKIASVTAPDVDAAVDAVKSKDEAEGLVGDSYAEVTETVEEPKSEVTVNSDEVVPETEEVKPEETKPADETKPEGEEVKPEDGEGEDAERQSNSFKGVAAYVKRAYGINLNN